MTVVVFISFAHHFFGRVVFFVIAMVVSMLIFFHPRVACGLTVFFGCVVCVLVSGGVVAGVTFVIIVSVFFHPHVASRLAVNFVVDVVVGVVCHVMANAFFVFIVVLFIAVSSVVVVSVSSTHRQHGHGKVWHVLGFEFERVLAFFKVEDVHN